MANRPAGSVYALLDELREREPAFRSTRGFWLLTRHDAIMDACRSPDLFSNRAISALDPDPAYRWIPEMLDPPEHTVWRRLLRPLFTPARARAMRDGAVRRCADLVDGLAARGTCDFVADFARVFPTSIFLELMGLPTERLPEFLTWANAILHTPSHQGGAARRAAMADVAACFAELIAARRRDPHGGAPDVPRDSLQDGPRDIVTAALSFRVGGRPVTDEELLSLFVLLFLAGLDTVSATLSYAFWHLARHDADRTRVATDPGVVPSAVEELLRAHAIVIIGRKVTHDTDVHGCPMKAGDMVLLPLAAATRDPRAFPDAHVVDLDRHPNRHIAFGAGPHHCLGAHLARMELQIALREWHARIPDYRVLDDAHVTEHAGQVLGLESLPLEWST
ncbi:cytochrome P450 [Actinomadura chibensis]|uniref:cytochrome P450 n=1 Tax=Actinomadura chibensis TaxID=392828 RepID=UPI001470A254|nr:cytochrome P450 [Actinomadura chibensis]